MINFNRFILPCYNIPISNNYKHQDKVSHSNYYARVCRLLVPVVTNVRQREDWGNYNLDKIIHNSVLSQCILNYYM